MARMKRLLTVLSVAIVAAVATMGPAAAATDPAPSKLFNLGTGKILNWDGQVDPPPGSGLHLWVRVTHPGLGVSPGFSAPYQLRNPVTGLCLQNYGLDAHIVLTVCATDPAGDSPQLWQHHRMPDRIAHQSPFGFIFSRSSGQVLTAVPAPGLPTEVVTADPVDLHSATASLQLWTALPA